MTYEQFKDALTKAGNKYGGHVTNGSLHEQLKVIGRWELGMWSTKAMARTAAEEEK